MENCIPSYSANPGPLRAGPGVPGPRTETHDEPLENLGKTMVSLGCSGNIWGAATSPLVAPGSRARFTGKPYKTNGKTAFPAQLHMQSGKAQSLRRRRAPSRLPDPGHGLQESLYKTNGKTAFPALLQMPSGEAQSLNCPCRILTNPHQMQYS